jgi:DNA-binding FadR family transcriptional regulator
MQSWHVDRHHIVTSGLTNYINYMTSRQPSTRLYGRVADDLARQIAAGKVSVGQRLPSERDLALTYGVSRPTIREAIIALEVDGLVEVRQGSGVYVIASSTKGGQRAEADVGPFELLEARRAIEGEACAMAAIRISDAEIDALTSILAEMQSADGNDVDRSEEADYRFHMAIAAATQNSGMVAAVEMLWAARARSPQYRLMSSKAHAAGVVPLIHEHAAIIDGLRRRDPDAARDAMRDHLNRVLDSLMEATEVHEVEQARQRVAAQRRRYASN